MYKVTYSGSGRIEVDLPSIPGGLVIEHGKYAMVNLTDTDKRIINSISNLGIRYQDVSESKKPKKAKVEKEDKREVDKEIEKVVEEKPSKEDLMKNTASELREILKNKGFEETASMTKSEMSDKILEIW